MSGVSGWYYDAYQDLLEKGIDGKQMIGVNRLTTISLHANSLYTSKDKWEYCKGIVERNEKGKIERTDLYDEDGYLYEPICTAPLQEDFQVTVQNSWSDLGGDPTGDIVNSLRTNLAPFAGTISEGLNTMLKEQKFTGFTDEEKNSTVGQLLMSIVEKTADLANGKDNVNDSLNSNKLTVSESRLAKYLNSALMVNSGKFSIYQGSNLNFQNMGMKFTIMPKWDPETGVFETVQHQLRDIYRYFFGEFIDMSEVLGTDKAGTLLSKLTWQRPPGGYQADMSQLDAIQKGSLKLKLGGIYSICNVVVESASLTFSRQSVKNPRVTYETLKGADTISESDYISPLSCDINLVLRPCTRYSDTTFKNIMEGAGMQKEKEDLSRQLIDNLHKIKTGNLAGYGSIALDGGESAGIDFSKAEGYLIADSRDNWVVDTA
jgi:hypothetical protein